MKQYIGTKMVKAEPAFRWKMGNGSVVIRPKSDKCVFIFDRIEDIQDGYKVIYEDGYESWSPKEVFEKAYRETDGMSFGLAIEAAKMGRKIARKGWNGKNQHIELAYGISYKNNTGRVVNCGHEYTGNRAFAFVETSGVQMGWLASQADMLAEDWYIVE